VLAGLDGTPVDDDVPRVVVTEEWRRSARLLWNEDVRPRVAMQPGAAFGSAKRWFPERFARLARELSERGMDVAFVGGEKDRDVVARVAAGAPGARDLSGRTSIGVLAAVLESADVLVTNDTGPMHLAAACGTPTLAIFGSTNPLWTAPFGPGHRVIREETACSPCYLRECRIGTLCMERVSVKRVLAEVLEIAGGTS
jgi:heptosyltransferase-2